VIVRDAMARLPCRGDVLLEFRPCDIEESRFVSEFMRRGCSCHKWEGKACSLQFYMLAAHFIKTL
jgi:hypothetical protein